MASWISALLGANFHSISVQLVRTDNRDWREYNLVSQTFNSSVVRQTIEAGTIERLAIEGGSDAILVLTKLFSCNSANSNTRVLRKE